MCRWKENGAAQPMKVIEFVPVSDRLPALSEKYGIDKMSAILAKAITKTLANFNLRVGMTSDQVVDLAFKLIEESHEDQLAFEDIMLFLDGMVTSKYGKVYDRMDIPTFFEMLEVYREQRHQAFMRHKEEEHIKYKGMGDSRRSTDDITTEVDAHRDAMKMHLQKLSKNK